MRSWRACISRSGIPRDCYRNRTAAGPGEIGPSIGRGRSRSERSVTLEGNWIELYRRYVTSPEVYSGGQVPERTDLGLNFLMRGAPLHAVHALTLEWFSPR